MTRKLFLPLCLIALLLTACDNDDFATGAESPIFDKLTLSTYNAAPTEEVTGYVTYQYEGKDVIKMDYTVRAIATDHDEIVAQGALIGETLKAPTFKFKAPDKLGSYRIVFAVTRVSVSTGNAQGGPYVPNPSSVFSILTVE